MSEARNPSEAEVLELPIELRGERMHIKCMVGDERRMTVFFLNRERMAGRRCCRCGARFDKPRKEDQ